LKADRRRELTRPIHLVLTRPDLTRAVHADFAEIVSLPIVAEFHAVNAAKPGANLQSFGAR
jgi:hypothetical protein